MPTQTNCPSNRQVIATLSTLPENDPFGSIEDCDKAMHDFFERLYTPLKKIFTKSTKSSKANAKQIEALKQLTVSTFDCFPRYEKDPLKFWENDIHILRYSDQEPPKRAKAFLESAYQLHSDIDGQLVLQRFVNLATYKLFQRAYPAPRVQNHHVNEYLKSIGVSEFERKVDRFCVMIRRGQRERNFCLKLAQQKSDANGKEDNEIYAPLFCLSIPDGIWDTGGLVGEDSKKAMQHLRKLRGDSNQFPKAAAIAKRLLDFHANLLVWLEPETRLSERKRNVGNRGGTRPNAGRKRSKGANSISTPTQESTADDREEVNERENVAQILNEMSQHALNNGHELFVSHGNSNTSSRSEDTTYNENSSPDETIEYLDYSEDTIGIDEHLQGDTEESIDADGRPGVEGSSESLSCVNIQGISDCTYFEAGRTTSACAASWLDSLVRPSVTHDSSQMLGIQQSGNSTVHATAWGESARSPAHREISDGTFSSHVQASIVDQSEYRKRRSIAELEHPQKRICIGEASSRSLVSPQAPFAVRSAISIPAATARPEPEQDSQQRLVAHSTTQFSSDESTCTASVGGIVMENTFNRITTMRLERPYESPIFIAVQEGNVTTMLNLFYEEKASIYDVDPYGLGLFYYASYYCWKSHGAEMAKQVCALLIAAGANTDWLDDLNNKTSETLLDSALVSTAMVGGSVVEFGRHCEEIGALFDMGLSEISNDYLVSRGFTPLHQVLLRINSEQSLEEYLYSLKKEELDVLLNCSDAHYRTPLTWAVEFGWFDAVCTLLRFGADPNQLTFSSRGYSTLLHAAVTGPASQLSREGHRLVIKNLLMAGVDVNAKDHEGWTPLHIVASWGVCDLDEFHSHPLLDWSALTNDGKSVDDLAPFEQYSRVVFSRHLEELAN